MWAPWRMEYILGPKDASCIFCSFPQRNSHREDLVLVVEEHAFVCLNKYPFAAGHLLVVPRRHVSSLSDLDDAEADALFRLLRKSVARLTETLHPEGVNVGFNLGKAAGAGIAEHLHAHVVPRWVGDTNFMPVVADVRVMPEYLEQTYDKLVPLFLEQA
jgi:ATP adenylyltransferase